MLLLLFFQATANALVTGITGSTSQSDADVVVYAATARGNPAVSVLDSATVEQVQQVPGVAAAGGVGQTFVVANRGSEDEDAVVVGLDFAAPGVPTTLAEGRLPAAEGEALFSTSGFSPAWEVGDIASLQGSDVEVEVVGIADDAAANASPTLYLPPATYESILRSRIGPAAPVPLSFVAVAVESGMDADAVAASIGSQVEGVEALPKDQAVAALPGISTITRSFGILYILLYLVVAIVTGVFFLILTVQKRDALVLLRAVGAERRDVVRLVLLQVLGVVGIGVLLGAALAGGLLRAAQDTFGASLDARTTITSGLAVLAIGLLASFGAIRRVNAIEPVEATRSGGLS